MLRRLLVLFIGRLKLFHDVFEVWLDDLDLILVEQLLDDLIQLVCLLLS